MIEKDNEGAGPEPLTENKRNALLMRSGEKAVLHYLSDTVDKLLPLLDKNLQEVKKEMKKETFTED